MGKRMPNWVETGCADYLNRLPGNFQLKIHEIPLTKRTKNTDLPRTIAQEGDLMLAAIPTNTQVVALEVKGKALSTPDLADKLQRCRDESRDLCLLIGGPEGLAPACRQRADQLWSLSNLTLPHPLVRVLVAEQIYRAWTLIVGHPYHR